jgi:glycosyltransferase involved in cell wall biosynthesis
MAKNKVMERHAILHYTETSYPGGSETILAYIAKNLDPEKYYSLACVMNKGWLTDHLDEIGVEYIIIENKRSFDIKYLLDLITLIKKRNIKLVHAHEFVTDFYGSLAARLTGIPAIGTIHGKGYFTEKWRRKIAFKAAIAMCSRMIAVSDDLRSYLIGELNLKNTDKILTLHNGIDLQKYSARDSSDKLRAQLSLKPHTLIAGTTGSLHPVKGMHFLLLAMEQVIKRIPNFKLIIAGTGDLEQDLKQQAICLGIEKNVLFLGFRSDIPDLLNLFDIYVCSSISEGLSLSILEAMATGKPVVATEVGGNHELINPDENGFLVPPADPAALAKKIIILAENRELRERLGRNGRAMVETKFSLEKMITEYQILYEKLIN